MEHLIICDPGVGDIQAAVAIHQIELPYTLNSILGLDHLYYLYSVLREDENSYVGVARISNEVVGIISGSTNPSAIYKKIYSHYPVRGWINVMKTLLHHPQLLRQFIENRDINREIWWKGEIVIPVLSTIAVAPQVRGQGVGSALIRGLEKHIQISGENCYRVDTLITNPARSFYNKNGFIEVACRSGSVIMIKEIVDVEP